MRKNVVLIALLILVLILSACAAKQKQILRTEESQVKLRSIQSRVFDTTDRIGLLTTIIATLQDLGFVIDDASETLGTVSGTKRAYRSDSGCLGPIQIPYQLRVTVSTRPRGDTQMIVRANAQYDQRFAGAGPQTVEDAESYQQFFAALSKALFLEAQQVE
jgi:hypothetical protein